MNSNLVREEEIGVSDFYCVLLTISAFLSKSVVILK
ncbi:hypothetical protein Xen7305DRAFT_00046800 [Xenococcus sp. PCC 7305]|nr:hypothetical protein Xen7305DRAFT_00046800 [Xenococcus sp. PCC 7305]